MRRYSIIIPVYNRPEEVNELLASLVRQTYRNFEVLVIEDGSTIPCEEVVNTYRQELELRYFRKNNTGPGFSRNYGCERAEGDYLVIFDSDCILPDNYLEKLDLNLDQQFLDLFGGPDRALSTFDHVQRAINFSMTATLTTGGIRGSSQKLSRFTPRSFNMGFTREVFDKTGGFIITRMGEDIELSIRIRKMGFKTGLIPEAFVYHKRRSTFMQFFRQLHFFGRARININRFHPGSIKMVHLFPSVFTIGLILQPFLLWFSIFPYNLVSWLYVLYFLAIFLSAVWSEKNLILGILGLWAAIIQLTSYGLGFISEFLKGHRDPQAAARQE